MKDIELKNRYGDIHLLKYKEENRYLFNPVGNYVRFGTRNGEDISYVDPPGGPMLMVGSLLGDKKIAKIESSENGYMITLK